jgi:hypothetical protein
MTKPLTVEGFARADINSVEFVPTEVAQPEWLIDLARRADASGSILEVACAMGSIQRLSYDSPEEIARHLADLFNGTGALDGPAGWAAGLSDHQRATIVDLARVEIDRCLDEMERIAASFVCRTDDDEVTVEGAYAHTDWASALERLWMRRDDLEGARVMLAIATGQSDIHLQLAQWDRLGRRMALWLPRAALPTNPRIDRIAEVDITAWWGRMSLVWW